MYYPYFRGKQFELGTIRESAVLLAESDFTPIIEPVKEALNGLEKTLKAICDAGGQAIVLVNPECGDHSEDGSNISQLLAESFAEFECIAAGVLLTQDISTEAAIELFNAHSDHQPVFVHAGFTDPKGLAEALGDTLPNTTHIFIENQTGKLYWKNFKSSKRILVRDGFRRQKNNSSYPPLEKFSDLHVTYAEEEGMDGFGDFLIVGNEFSEGGGPAYAVAIHLTFIDSSQDDVMYIYHFISTTNDTPTDPAGKFSQALEKLIASLDSGDSKIFESTAIEEFRAFHENQHFPGLGYVKKLSLRHHIETLADYMS